MARTSRDSNSNCPVTRGEVDVSYYAERDEVWRDLELSAPSRRALVNADISNLDDLRRWSFDDLAKLHGMGPKALRILQEVVAH
jgi:DNA-directed RNA polymerase alpha subunit